MSFNSGRSSAVARGAVSLAALATFAAAAAPAAQAAKVEKYLYYETYFSGYDWDGGGTIPPADRLDTGFFGGWVTRDVDFADSLVPGYVPPTTGICGVEEDTKTPDEACYDTQQLRGGAIVERYTPKFEVIPRQVLPGDVIRLVHPDDKSTLGETTVTAPSAVTSSVIGSSEVTVERRPDSTSVAVSLQRRVSRNVERSAFVPGTYQWVLGAPGTGESLCTIEVWNYPEMRYETKTDTAPAAPVAAPPAGQAWVLDRLTNCSSKSVAITGAPYETIAEGRIVAAADGSYTARFDTPLQAGDAILTTERHETTANDIETTVVRYNASAVGTVPPPDKTAPKLTKFDLGASNTSIKSFLKFGLFTFVTLDEPGTVTQQLLLPAPAPKKSKKGKKKPATPKPPTVLAAGSAKTSAPGETAKILLTSTKEGRKALRKLKKGKPAKATIVTTITDAAGNAFSSQAALKLSGK